MNKETTILARFKEVVALHPARTALAGGEWEPTYAELDATTDFFASLLLSHDGNAGDRVALLMNHDAPLIAACLSVLKAGRMVVVLNPHDPAERLRQIVSEAEPHVIVTDPANESLAVQLSQGRLVVNFSQTARATGSSPAPALQPADHAWLIFTSGSTGKPKGVIQTHCNLTHKVHHLAQATELTEQDRVILLGFPSSGQGVTVMWCGLLTGAALYPFPIADRGISRLAEWMNAKQISVYVSSASIFRHFVKTLGDQVHFPQVRLVWLASEPSTSGDFAGYQKHFPDHSSFLITLSSSEMGNLTVQRFNRQSVVGEGRLPIGRPAAGKEILLLDESGREVAEGETGEMVVRSRHLSPGYWRDGALTAERFSMAADGVRIFRSGDLARRTAAGTLYFAGRKDARVKIHGHRIEVSEIENILAGLAEVEQAVVAAQLMPGGEMQLVAHVVLRTGCGCTAEKLRQTLRPLLPGYMIPAHFIFLEKIPLLAGGKVDREKLKHLPVPAPAFSGEAPVTATEILLAQIWQKVFGRPQVGRQDNFFDLGGDSLNATVIAAEIFAALNVELEMRAFADHPALVALAAVVDASPCVPKPAMPELVRVPRDRPLLLSFTQERTWKYSQTVQGSLGYVMSGYYRLSGPLDVEMFQASLNYLVRRHEILRTTFHMDGDRPVAVIHPATEVPLPYLDFSGRPGVEAEATELLRDETRVGFDFQRGPLFRFKLVRISADEHRLLRISHHIISDNVSWNLLFRELVLVYDAKFQGRPLPLPEFEPLQYVDYAARQRAMLHAAGNNFREMCGWWQPVLARPVQPLKMPFRRRRDNPEAKPAEGFVWWGLDPTVSCRLGELARRENVTAYTVRLAALGALWCASHPEMVLGTFVTDRNCVATQNMFGDFSNLVTVRLRCDPRQTFLEWLHEVQGLVTETQTHGSIPYELLCEEMRRRKVVPPPVDIIFSLINYAAPEQFGGLTLAWLDQVDSKMPWGFSLAFDPRNEENGCRLTFDARIYDPARVRKWLERFKRLLNAVSEKPDATITELLSAGQKWNWFLK